MKRKKYYLDYVDENGRIRSELMDVISLKNVDININDFFRLLNDILINTLDDDLVNILYELVRRNPAYSFGIIYYLLKDAIKKEKLGDLQRLEVLNNKKINMFMIVNFLKEM